MNTQHGPSDSLMDDGITVYTPGVNCIHCGRFIGRDGALYYEHFEMTSTVASLDGECATCIRERGHDHACCPPNDCCGGPCAAHPCFELTT